jgi:large subunit ribosomal protein L1
MSISKRHKENLSSCDRNSEYNLKEAVSLMKSLSSVKFDESVDLSINLGVDPRHADQLVRGTVSLPNGTGKNVRVVVIAKDDDKISSAKDAGADDAGFDELVSKIEKGWLDFDVLVATPDVMPQVGKLGRVLGPRGLMPNPKTGTVTNDISKAVSEVKAGRVEFRVDKLGIIHVAVGKLSFDEDKICENINVCMGAIMKARPSSVKGTYLKKFTLSSTMGPGIRVDKKSFVN